MILQVDVTLNQRAAAGGRPLVVHKTGFYRIMVVSPLIDELPGYWMYNGDWHTRMPPDLNPPRPWFL